MSNIRCINFYDLCRICTASSEQKTNIYSPDGRAKNLSYKIAECLTLNIDENDRLPKVICAQCLQHVEQMYQFRNICKNSQTMLSNCLNYRTLQSDDNGINDSGKSISILGNAQLPSTLTGNGLTVQTTGAQTPNDLLSSIMQAVQVQQQPVLAPQPYSITMDSSLQQASAPQHETQNATAKSDKPNTLEEFIRLKPDIKITALGKKDTSTGISTSAASNVKQQPTQTQIITQQSPLRTMPSMPSAQLQIQPQQFNDQLQQQQALWQQLQQLQQQQLQQQLQQLTTQLQAQAQFTPANNSSSLQQATDDAMSDSKKPKLNLVLSSPAAPQFATTLPQFSAQPQLQLQLGTNMMSPNKCFLPITIRDENSDQQIVAHIDTKNLMLPTTYQVQMKLQPQLATADGQPIMQLTPTSIPATLQLTPQTLGSATGFQSATATASLQSQLIAAQPQQQQQQQLQQNQQQQQLQQQLSQMPLAAAQVTSQKIIRSSHPNASPQLVITNVKSEATTPTKTTTSPTFKTPSLPTRQPQQQTQLTAGSAGSNVINITPNTEFTKRLVAQVKQQQLQQQVKQQQTATSSTTTATAATLSTSNVPASSNVTVQRLSSSTTITKVKPQSSQTKMPVINKQNITISRVTTQVSASAAKLLQANKPTTPSNSSQQSRPPAVQPPTLQIVKQKPAVSTAVAATPTTTTSSAATSVANARKPIRKQPEQLAKPRQQQAQLLPVPTTPPQSDRQAPQPGAEAAAAQAALMCPTCGREFKKKEHLTQHVKLHAGLRPFKCTEESCNKAFSRKEHLSRHLVSHSGQKMFTCEVCKKPFSRKDNLNKHKRIHSTQCSETYFSCEICNRSFVSKVHHDKHKEMHGKSPNGNTANATAERNQTNTKTATQQTAVQTSTPTQQLQMLPNVPQPQSQPQIMHVQLQPTVVTTQDLAGNTITITQAPDSNLQTSLANFVQLGFPQFQNGNAAPSQIVCKIEK